MNRTLYIKIFHLVYLIIMNRQLLNNKFNQNDYEPRRFGLKFDPPQIVIEYFIPSIRKLKHHKIKLNRIKNENKLEEILKDIYEKHYMYLDTSKIKQNQIIGLVDKLLNHIKSLKGGLSTTPKEIKSNKENIKVDSTLYQQKEEATVEYDDYDKFDNSDLDLNKLELEEINKIKAKMEKTFESHLLKPGDPAYEYDIRKDFNIKQKKSDPEWDSFDIEDIDV